MHRIYKKTAIWACTGLVLYVLSPLPASHADDATNNERANTNRLISKAQSQSKLGYDPVIVESNRQQIDYAALSYQISILSRLIEDMQQQSAEKPSNALSPMVPDIQNNLAGAGAKSMHGPDGPTVKSVKLIAEYQLLRHGNKRLRVGKIEDHANELTVEIETVDGSLVEKYVINKQTGAWLKSPK